MMKLAPTLMTLTATFLINSFLNGNLMAQEYGPQIADLDGDGLCDAHEILGWMVKIDLGDGEIIERKVYSDPTRRDSNGDGLSDMEATAHGIDPSAPGPNFDTDGDGIADVDEILIWGTSPAEFDFACTAPRELSLPSKAPMQSQSVDQECEQSSSSVPTFEDEEAMIKQLMASRGAERTLGRLSSFTSFALAPFLSYPAFSRLP